MFTTLWDFYLHREAPVSYVFLFVSFAFRNIGFMSWLFPDACILHAVRHPADCALSCFEQNFSPRSIPYAFNLTHLAEEVERHHRIMAHWQAALPGLVMPVHYAHMVADTERMSRKVLAHCGMPWDDRVLQFYENDRVVYTASQLQVRKPIYTSSLGKWTLYKKGLVRLLYALRDVIARYESAARLPSSMPVLRELFAQEL